MQIGILGRAEWLVKATARCQRYHRHGFEHRSTFSRHSSARRTPVA